MPTIELKVTEKWTKRPIPNLVVTVNGEYLARTDREGWVVLTLPIGTYMLCVEDGEVNYKKNCQTVNLISDMVINISMVPIFKSLS